MLTFESASTSSPAVAYFLTACIGISLYNPTETIILIFATFKRYGGYYFWSLLIACLGLIVAVIGYSTYFFNITSNKFVQTTVTVTGWSIFVVAQSLVLWSRLYLVIQSQRILHGVLAMIIINAFVLLIPTVVMAFGNDTVDPSPEFLRGYTIMEKIQLSLFSTQEFVISGLYLWGTINLLKLTSEKRKRNLILQLFTINVILVLMDCVLLGVEFAGYRILQINLKWLVYSFKLKLEIAVLSRLVSFVKGPHEYRNQSLGLSSSVPNSTHQDRTKSEWRPFSQGI